MPSDANKNVPVREALRSNHGRVVVLFLVRTILLACPILGLIWLCDVDLTIAQCWSIVCVVFLFAWWWVYFRGARLKIWTLRRFLIDKSQFRSVDVGAETDGQDEWSNMKDKSQSTVQTLSILVAVITLFLALVLQEEAQNAYQQIVRFAAVVAAVITITCMVFAIDILDTVSNLFIAKHYPDGGTPTAYSKYFYRQLGPSVPKGGISYAYYGFALFSAFVIMSVAFFHTAYAGIGVAAYTYLGYPFWFGYVGKEYGDGARVEFDQKAMVPPYLLGGFFLLGTMLAELGPAALALAKPLLNATGVL